MGAYSNHTTMCLFISELRAAADILGKGNYELEGEGSTAIKKLKSDGN